MSQNNFVIKKEQTNKQSRDDLSPFNEVSTHKTINQYIFSN